jgi:ABC-2 type transport system ATP-binding protein
MSIKVENLFKIYGTQSALDNVSFEINKGEVVGFLGPNGAGKSTTMKIATGFLPPSSGKIFVEELNVLEQPQEVKRIVGYLPENNPLYTEMYILEYLEFVGKIHGMKGNALKKRIEELIEITGLGRERHKKIEALSKGYRQRVGLAQALIHDPKVLFLDEPTSGLDPNQIVEIRNLISHLGQEKTVVLSSHIMQEVEAICNRAIIINLGKIVADDKVVNLKKKLKGSSQFLIEFSNDVNIKDLEKISGVENVEKLSSKSFKITSSDNLDPRAEIFDVSKANNWTLIEIKSIEQNLENIFHQLTQK